MTNTPIGGIPIVNTRETLTIPQWKSMVLSLIVNEEASDAVVDWAMACLWRDFEGPETPYEVLLELDEAEQKFTGKRNEQKPLVDVGMITLEEAKAQRRCRICGENVYTNAELNYPETVVLNFGREFAHKECLQQIPGVFNDQAGARKETVK